jgi:hypothetical protein
MRAYGNRERVRAVLENYNCGDLDERLRHSANCGERHSARIPESTKESGVYPLQNPDSESRVSLLLSFRQNGPTFLLLSSSVALFEWCARILLQSNLLLARKSMVL